MNRTGLKLAGSRERNGLSYDLEMLCLDLGCGKATARKVAEAAGARFKIGRRVLYSRSKIEAYIASETSQTG